MKRMRKKSAIFLIILGVLQCNGSSTYVHHSRLGAGFYAEMFSVVSQIVLFLLNESAGRELDVQWTEEFFPYKNGKDENGWILFFDPIGYVQSAKDIKPNEIVHDQHCLKKWLEYDNFYQYRLSMNKILKRYIKIKPHILDEVENYYKSHMDAKTVIGVHVRFAAVHAVEKPGIVTLEHYFAAVDELARTIKEEYVIYLATDSNYVVRQFLHKYGTKLLYIDAIRSNYNEDVPLIYERPNYWLSHAEEFHKKKPGYKGGKDALMEVLLLSRSDYLIHSTSNVSDFVTFFNPDIRSIFLPKHITAKPYKCLSCLTNNKWYEKAF